MIWLYLLQQQPGVIEQDGITCLVSLGKQKISGFDRASLRGPSSSALDVWISTQWIPSMQPLLSEGSTWNSTQKEHIMWLHQLLSSLVYWLAHSRDHKESKAQFQSHIIMLMEHDVRNNVAFNSPNVKPRNSMVKFTWKIDDLAGRWEKSPINALRRHL